MEVATLPVEERSVKGTNAVRQLRDTGKIPMVLYGGKGESVSLQADYDSVKRHLTHRLRVYKLELGGKEHPSFLKSVQWDCLTDEPLHLDFQRIKMDEPLKLEIRIVTVGHPAGAAAGARLVLDVKALNLSCMPDSVPDEVEIPVAHLEIGDKILAKEVELPEGVTLEMPEDKVVIRLLDPKAELPPEEPDTPAGDSATDPDDPGADSADGGKGSADAGKDSDDAG